jgi:hypothetical protein
VTHHERKHAATPTAATRMPTPAPLFPAPSASSRPEPRA